MLKVTMFYNQTNHGWTETWWANGTTPPLQLNPALKAIMAAAVAFRSPLTTLEWVRFSVVGSPQKVNSFRLSNKVAAVTNPDSPPDVVSTDALWRIITSNFARRTIALRGLLDNSVLRNPTSGAFEPTPGLVAQVDAYLNKVYSAGWLIRVTENRVNTPALPTQPVVLMKRNPVVTDQTDITFNPAIAGLVAGQKVRFFGSIDPKKLPLFPKTPTLLEVIPGPPQIIKIAYSMPNELTYAPPNLLCSPLVYNFDPIYDWDFQSLSKRDTGRPFGSSRGRRSAAGSRR